MPSFKHSKKIILASILGFASPVLAQTISIPDNLAANIASSTSGILSNTGMVAYLTLIIGTLLAAVLLEILISAIRHR